MFQIDHLRTCGQYGERDEQETDHYGCNPHFGHRCISISKKTARDVITLIRFATLLSLPCCAAERPSAPRAARPYLFSFSRNRKRAAMQWSTWLGFLPKS